MYRIFSPSSNRIRTNVIMFAAMIGSDSVRIPYHVQRRIHAAKRMSMASERSRVSLSFHARTTCGMNEIVVRAPAI